MWRLIFLLVFPFTISAQLKRFQFSENKMGSSFDLIFYHTDSAEAVSVAKECFSIVDSLNNIFSDYSSESEVSKLALQTNQTDIKVSDELFSMILRSRNAWERSNKTFDITIGALTQLWRKAKKENRFPSEAEIKAAKDLSGFKNLVINERSKTISFKKPGICLDFGGIVPGYAGQRVIDFLKTKNVSIALADASGDIVMSDAPPGKDGWTIGINLPENENEIWEKKLELKNFAVSTSGDVYRYTIHNGIKYSHIIDPKTGYGVTSQRNVTVITKYGADADWLATACSILPIKKALALAKKEQAAILIAIMSGEKIVTHKSKSIDKYFQKKQP
ncbi:MAG TPA: FAD:protein FMN transferase [Chitinophagaceae bacterium]|nr:FAD:protein FMN transferase [Chitinophagaceae bacterium]